MAHARVLLVGALVFGVVPGPAGAEEPLLFPIDPTFTVTISYGDMNPLSGGTASGDCLFAANRNLESFCVLLPQPGGG